MPKNKKWTPTQMIETIQTSFSIRDVIIQLGLIPAGGNYSTVKNFIKNNSIDVSHFTGQAHNRGKTKNNGYSGVVPEPLESILISYRPRSSSHLKNRLINENIFKYKCNKCQLTIWNDLHIPLELDHINGDKNDQRIENLQLLCPNCHAQTPTYRGKNINRS